MARAIETMINRNAQAGLKGADGGIARLAEFKWHNQVTAISEDIPSENHSVRKMIEVVRRK